MWIGGGCVSARVTIILGIHYTWSYPDACTRIKWNGVSILLGNQADAMIRWKLLEYFLVYKLCNSLDILIGLQWNMLYSKSNQRATGFLRQIFYCRQRLTEAVRQKSRYFFFFFKKKSSIYYTGRNGRPWQVQGTYLNTEKERSSKKGKRERWMEKCCAFTQGSRAATISQPLSKLNALGLSARKWTKLFMMILHGRVDGSYVSHSMTMCSRVWTSASPHGQLMGRWGRNLCLYSPMGVWPVVMRVKRAQSELVKPIEGSPVLT